MIKVAVVDDQCLVREGIAGLLSLSGKTDIVWQAANGCEALELIQTQPVDIVLADIRMPIMDGIAFVRALRQRVISTPILMLTTFDDYELFNQSLQAGANGFLLKDISLEKLVHSIETLVAGGFMTDCTMLNKWRSQDAKAGAPRVVLTEREQQILRLLADGCSNKEIVQRIYLAEGTVRNHVSNILSKLDCRDRTQAVLKAMELNLLVPRLLST